MSKALFFLTVILSFLLFLLITQKAGGQTRAEIEETVTASALEHGVDPDLAMAIMEVESSGNPKAVGALGERGLFQLRPEFYPQAATADVPYHVDTAVRSLSRMRTLCGPAFGDAFFLCHNTGVAGARKLQNVRATRYYKKVTKIYNERKAQAKHARR